MRGWLESSETGVGELLTRFEGLPLGAILHTDIARDGLLEGPNLDSTAALARTTEIPVLASGGVSSVADLLKLARARVIAGAVVGKALYTGAIELEDALREVASC